MRYLLIAAALVFCHPVMADQPQTVISQQDDREHFEGTWITVRNRKLDGRMDCFSVRAGDKWRARFAGVWQGIKFEYTVDFDGRPSSDH